MCLSVLKGYFWLKIPILLAFTSVLINNLAILSFMRRQVPVDSNPKNKPAPIIDFDCSNRVQWNAARTETQSDDERSHNDPDESGSTSEENTYVQEQPSSVGCERYSDQKLYQQRRLHLVSSQAFLFVVSFFLCNVWTATGAMVESVGTDATEMKKLMVQFYPVFVCQAFFAPLQGFLNMMVYIRPRYLTLRHEYPRETRIWVIQRAILGEDKKPCTPPLQDGQNQPTESNKTKEPTLQVQQQEHSAKVPHVSRVSSLTASDGDFDHISAGAHPEDRWKQPTTDKTQAPPVSTRFHSDVRLSQLDIISEIEESVVSSKCSPMKRKMQHKCHLRTNDGVEETATNP